MKTTRKDWILQQQAKILAVYRQFKGQTTNTMEIEGKIVFEDKAIRPLLFLSFFKNMKRDTESMKNMQMDLLEFRSFQEALRELVATKKSGYRNSSGGAGPMKSLFLEYSEKASPKQGEPPVEQYWINISESNDKMGVAFDKYQARALLKAFEQISTEMEQRYDSSLWQRSLKKFKENVSGEKL